MDSPRIYLVGAHATGKTTLARWVRDRFGLPMISEVARAVLAEMEARVDALRTDVDLVDRYQQEVFRRQIEAEAAHRDGFVSDRAFCNLAYAAQHASILPEVFADPRLRPYMESVASGIVFFVRPHQELLADDGVRERLDWEEVVRIDGMVKFMLEMFAIPYVPLESLSMQERVRTVERVLTLAGVEPAVTLAPAARPSRPTPRPVANGNAPGNGASPTPAREPSAAHRVPAG